MFILLVFRGNFQRTDGNICLGLRSSQSLYTSCRENMHWNSYGQSWERAWPHHIHFSYLAPITGKKKGTQPSVWHFMKETNHWQQEQNTSRAAGFERSVTPSSEFPRQLSGLRKRRTSPSLKDWASGRKLSDRVYEPLNYKQLIMGATTCRSPDVVSVLEIQTKSFRDTLPYSTWWNRKRNVLQRTL